MPSAAGVRHVGDTQATPDDRENKATKLGEDRHLVRKNGLRQRYCRELWAIYNRQKLQSRLAFDQERGKNAISTDPKHNYLTLTLTLALALTLTLNRDLTGEREFGGNVENYPCKANSSQSRGSLQTRVPS